MMSGEARETLQGEREAEAALARLAEDGFIVPGPRGWKTSRRWQQAMARAAAALYQHGDTGDDLRVPIAVATLELYSGTLDDEAIASLIEAMLPIESASLGLVPR